jgi:uncharacterized protein (DUF342 family)
MPYKISGKGDGLGCKGYAVQDDSGKTVGCHPTRLAAENHLQALYANVTDAKKDMSLTVEPRYPGAGIKRPEQGNGGKGTTGSNIKSKYGKKPKKTNRGRNSDNNPSTGAIGAGGTSMGAL